MSQLSQPLSDFEVQQRLIRTVSAHLGIRRSQLAMHADLRRHLGADLLDRIELAVTVEEEFGITIPIQNSMVVRTVSDLVQLVSTAVRRKYGEHSANDV